VFDKKRYHQTTTSTTTTTKVVVVVVVVVVIIIIIIIIIIIRGMGEVPPLYGVDPALVLTKPGVQQCNLRHKPPTSLHIRLSVRSE
jgi:hypothetical protein